MKNRKNKKNISKYLIIILIIAIILILGLLFYTKKENNVSIFKLYFELVANCVDFTASKFSICF